MAAGGWKPVPVDDLAAEPSGVRELVQDLRRLGDGLLGCGAAFRSGAALPAVAFEGLAGDRFRSLCRHQREVAVSTALQLTALAGAADELARDLTDLRLLLQQMRGVAHEGGLEVGGQAIWPPHPTERREDSAALGAAWSAYDRCWTLRDTYETRRDAAERAWRAALLAPPAVPVEPAAPVDPVGHRERSSTPERGTPVRDRVLPPADGRPDAAGKDGGDGGGDGLLGLREAPRFDERSRARWIEGHRGHDGEWVHAHWQPVGRDGHGSVAVEVVRFEGGLTDDGEWRMPGWQEVGGHPHAGEHPSGATLARWVDGRWHPVVPDPRPPAVA